MAVAASAGLSSSDAGIWVQIQKQLVQRNADQAEQQARVLRAQADNAQSVADRAQENARTLRIESSQARVEADSAQRGVAALNSLTDLQAKISGLRVASTPVLEAPASGQLASLPPVEVNLVGPTMGTLVDVMA